jgi:hypothetical protein
VPGDKVGLLHAKIAVADGHDLLITSAAFTEYAMISSMGMGLLVHGGDQPTQVEAPLLRSAKQGVSQAV